ncbi:MAG: DUF4350 domain-containing protein [Candidatus Hydrogenedentes bacterium]|nr:DUF4350 domain-containing protein [Candidatus Hydrogenedentota bacterium]
MRNSNRLYLLALLLVIAGFAYGAATLFLARYSRGDVYAPYSSYRADPLGTKALFEAMHSVRGVHVTRNIEPLDRLARNRAVTLFLNGMTFGFVGTQEIEAGLAEALDDVMARGGRVVISFAPVVMDVSYREKMDKDFQERMDERWRRKPAKKDDEESVGDQKAEKGPETEKPEAEPAGANDKKREETIIELPDKPNADDTSNKEEQEKEKQDEKDGEDEKRNRDRYAEYEAFMPRTVSWDKQWGVQLQFDSLEPDPLTNTFKSKTARRAIDAPVPEQLPVRTTLRFAPSSEEWRAIYSVGEKSVVIERPVGEGTLVLVADAYLLSNEAMRAERHPDLIAWLAGANPAIVFDEVTLGTERTRGLASLLWQYRLQGVVATLILIALLYIWKNGQPLVPPFHDALPTDAYAYVGKDSASGFTNLLKRSVPSTQVLRTCLAEWEKSFSHRSADLAESIRDAKAILLREDSVPAKQRDVVRAYKEICAAFSRHRLG